MRVASPYGNVSEEEEEEDELKTRGVEWQNMSKTEKQKSKRK